MSKKNTWIGTPTAKYKNISDISTMQNISPNDNFPDEIESKGLILQPWVELIDMEIVVLNS
jgi:hypothetical protein